MANYIQQLRRASFRGLLFELPAEGNKFGRSVITDEYPGRDTPSHEDMGNGVESFTVTARIGGDDFLRRSEDFKAALLQAGPGTLIHPYYGEIQVIVKNAQRGYTQDAIGVDVFTIEFEKYGDAVYPVAASDTLAGLALSKDNMLSALRGDFLGRFVTESLPDFVGADALKQARGWVSTLEGSMASGGLLTFLTGGMPSWTSIGLGVVDDAFALFDRVSALVKPIKLPVVGSKKTSTPQSATAVIRSLDGVAATTAPQVTGVATSTLPVRQQNAVALEGLFRGTAAAAMADCAQYADYESKEEALAVRALAYDSISSLRDLYGRTGWDDSWRAAGQVMAAIHRDINERIGRLPQTVRVKSAGVASSLAIAQRIYGDDPAVIFDRADDIVRRNRVRHPGFIPAERLEVLIDA